MEKGEYIIEGGNVLSGEIRVSGAKNAVLPIIAASLLTPGVTVYNCPAISDTAVCMDIMRHLGCSCRLVGNVLSVETYGLSHTEISAELCGKMRSSITFLGALLGACGRAVVYCPGGCRLGKRPIDIHLNSLKLMGISVTEENGRISCEGKPKGTDIRLRYPSVGATENIILAAVCAEGATTVKNCAKEPEIVALCEFLNRCGAKIEGAGSDTIAIDGVARLHRCEYEVPGDRIEAGTYMCAAAITGGELFIKGAPIGSLDALTEVIRECGCVVKECRHCIYVDAPPRPCGIMGLSTAPYPALPTDMQAPLTAVLSVARGNSSIIETVFEARNRHIYQLNKMGADITCTDGCSFDIHGVDRLVGCEVEAEDLRGGAALMLAALAAEGKTVVKNAEYIMRGYENPELKLANVGAEIRRKRG
jgi:UDP-N-acetylglucosamine 1-carboxyvinyltransferase